MPVIKQKNALIPRDNMRVYAQKSGIETREIYEFMNSLSVDWGFCPVSGRYFQISIQRPIPNKLYNQKFDRQPLISASPPPIDGPSIGARLMAIARYPSILAPCFGGNISLTIARDKAKPVAMEP